MIKLNALRIICVGITLIGLTLVSCATGLDPSGPTSAGIQARPEQVILTVFRSPTCGCCGKWVEHMEAAGFTLKEQITEDMNAIKQQYGLPMDLASCHTTIADNYVIEGHIPASDVLRLLTEKPDIAGIAVPGMPIGSPGMESGRYVEPYTVFSFTNDGSTTTFSEHS